MSDQHALQRQRVSLPTKLNVGQVVLPFDLADSSGRRFSLWDYKGRRNLVLFFFHSGQCASCRDVLTAFATSYRRYQDLNAEILAISSDPPAIVKALAEALRLPFPLLCDQTGEVSKQYTGDLPAQGGSAAGVFVTDRYGALYYESAAQEESNLPSQEQIINWLQFIEIQCDECGAPEWPSR